jgi:hypothetical protein
MTTQNLLVQVDSEMGIDELVNYVRQAVKHWHGQNPDEDDPEHTIVYIGVTAINI